jgi:hypothetical protein
MDNPYSPENRLDSAAEPVSETLDSQIDQAAPVEGGEDTLPLSSDQSDMQSELGALNYSPEVESTSKLDAAANAQMEPQQAQTDAGAPAGDAVTPPQPSDLNPDQISIHDNTHGYDRNTSTEGEPIQTPRNIETPDKFWGGGPETRA